MLNYKFRLQAASLRRCCFAWLWDVGWEAGGTGDPAPVPLCQPHGGDFGEKLQQMSGVMALEATGARFAGDYLWARPLNNPS